MAGGQKNDSRKQMFEITEVRFKNDFCKEVLGNVQETADNSSSYTVFELPGVNCMTFY